MKFFQLVFCGAILLQNIATAKLFSAAFSLNHDGMNRARATIPVLCYERSTGDTTNHIMLHDRRSVFPMIGASIFGLTAMPSLSSASSKENSDGGKIVLNNIQMRPGTTEATLDPLAAIDRINTIYHQIESRYFENDLVDYVSIGVDADFSKLQTEMATLQRVSLDSLDIPRKMAFVINLYNTMIKIAFVIAGIPKNDLTRLSFFDTVAVNIGGDIFTFNDLENGILRANSVPPYHLTKPFSKGDEREHFALAKTDHRIHFALNCGAKSCPPVRKYTSTGLEDELQAAAIAFCEDDSNVRLDLPKRKLILSKIFKWYNMDFANSKEQVPRQILKYLTGEKKDALEHLLKSADFEIDFIAYDWTTNDSRSKTFS